MNPNIFFKEPECPQWYCHKALRQKTEGQKSTDKTHERYGDRPEEEKDNDAACIFCEELFAESKTEDGLG